MVRKYIKHFFLAVLSIIVLLPLFRIDLQSEYSEENRKLAVRPRFPGFNADTNELRSFTRGIESWLNDRIGFRRRLVSIYGVLHVYALGTTPHRQLMLGRDGHAFLASHENDDSNSFVKEVLGLPFIDDNAVASEAEQMIDLRRLAGSYDVPTVVTIIPQKPLLDHVYLPYYVRRFVNPENLKQPLEVRVKEALPPDIAQWIIYPYEDALMQNSLSPLYPKSNFHWTAAGRYTALMAAKIAEYFGLAAYEPPVYGDYEVSDIRSDLSHFAGFGLHDLNYLSYKAGVLEEAGVSSAVLTDKYPQLTDVPASYWVNTLIEEKRKLLWLGDSFSWAIPADLARYFNEVLCIEAWLWIEKANASNQDIKVLVKQMMSIYQPDYIVFSRHTISGLDYLFKQITADE
jgi:hypothetical protein